jgi:hypothetical protein
MKNTKRLPNGCTLYWKNNGVGGRTYSSDEIGGGVIVWDTALVSSSTLLAAMTQESVLRYKELREAQCQKKTKKSS